MQGVGTSPIGEPEEMGGRVEFPHRETDERSAVEIPAQRAVEFGEKILKIISRFHPLNDCKGRYPQCLNKKDQDDDVVPDESRE